MISALYIRKDSVYKKIGLDCWDEQKDARLWPGSNPCIVHPPCGAWGKLSQFCKHGESLKNLAPLAVSQVRENLGVLEHPSGSKLWEVCILPLPGLPYDEFGGFSISIDQSWWGFPAQKNTWLYIVGLPGPSYLPGYPISLDAIQYTVGSKIKLKSGKRVKRELPKSMRDVTVLPFAEWLVSLVNKIILYND